MRHQQAARGRAGQPVGAAGAEKCAKRPHLAQRAILHQWPAPHLVGARHGHEQHLFPRIQRNAVRAGRIGQQQVQAAAVRVIAIHAALRVVQPRLPLVREIEPTGAIKHQIVHALERFTVALAQHGVHVASGRVASQNAMPIIGHPQATVLMARQAVGPAARFSHKLPVIAAIDAQDAAVGNVRHIQRAAVVKDRPLQETIHGMARLVGVCPGAAPGQTQGVGHDRKHPRLDHDRRLEIQVPHDAASPIRA
ncbi:hypothetical protein D3C73_1065630 [compost metagenome]